MSDEEHHISDEQLMMQIAAGDEDAFAKIIRRYQNLIYGTAAKMLGNDSEVEDIAQQVFLRVYKAAPRYRASAKFTTWLLTICRNCVFTHLKKRRKHESLNDDEERIEIPDSQTASSAQNLLNAELEKTIQNALDHLPENQRMALVLQQYDHLDYDEIASVLNTSVSSVKSLLFRARASLRETLKNYLNLTATS